MKDPAVVSAPPRHARFTWIFAAALSAMLGCVVGINFVFDPLMMFHRPWLGDYYSANERYRVPGFARSLDYDTAIVGASTAIAIQPSDVRTVLGGAPLVQIMNGATISEESLAVSVTARQGKLKRAIWLIDPVIFNFGDRRADAPLPEYLYQGGASNATRYLLDRSTLIMSVALARHKLGGPQPDDFVSSLDALYPSSPTSDYSASAVKEAFKSDTALAELKRRERALYPPFDESKVAVTFGKYVAEVIRQHPDVAFDIVLPPSTVAFNQFIKSHFPQRFDQILFVRKLAYEQIPLFANARLFDMQIDASMTEDYSKFRDMLHFSPAIGSQILAAIRNGKIAIPSAERAAQSYVIESVARVPLP